MHERSTSRRDVLGLLAGGLACACLPLGRVLAEEEPAAPEKPPEPEIPVAKDFLLPMKVWSRRGWRFGVNWTHARCGKCRKNYRHVGEDVNLGRGYARYRVYAPEAGIVRQAFKDGRWAYCCVIEHRLPRGRKATSVCWHLAKPIVKVGQVVKHRQQIGVLADLGRGTHLHFGIRLAPFHRVLSCKGALPACLHLKHKLPKYPEKFTRPTEWVAAN
jgi:murein DD-endopeptidase MepM/ murein hydrolase activator NlpD